MHHSFHQQFSIEAFPDRAIHHKNEYQIIDQESLNRQQWMSLGTGVERSAIWDEDVTIAILEGEGCLCFDREVVMLEAGMLVFIPAHNPYELKAYTQLVFLMDCFEPDSSNAMNSVWVINL
jgi:mannose-6-phosphate isomerase-like protein (cupin superfamily)